MLEVRFACTLPPLNSRSVERLQGMSADVLAPYAAERQSVNLRHRSGTQFECVSVSKA